LSSASYALPEKSTAPEKDSVRYSFSKAAESYDEFAHHHREIARRLVSMAGSDGFPDRILELGCGTGILTEKLCIRFPNASITAIDISPSMIEICRGKISGGMDAQFIAGDAEDYLEAASGYEMIASSCCLQWFRTRSVSINAIHRALLPGGECLLAIPVAGMLNELSISFREGAGKEIRKLEMLKACEWERIITCAGFRTLSSSVQRISHFYDSPIDVLKSIRGIGAVIDQGCRAIGAVSVRRMKEYYSRRFAEGDSGQVPSTYEVLLYRGTRIS
jgi:malonyl-CoA O-methyltransferase